MAKTSSMLLECFSGSIIDWLETMSYSDRENCTQGFISDHVLKLHEHGKNLVVHFVD